MLRESTRSDLRKGTTLVMMITCFTKFVAFSAAFAVLLGASSAPRKLLVRQRDAHHSWWQHPELLGIGIDEGAWIEVHGDSFTVFEGQVAIYDAIRYGLDSLQFLSHGEKFDLRCAHAC